MRDGDRLGRRGLAIPGPACEGIAGAGRIVQRERGGFDGVCGGVAAGVRAASEVVGDAVGDGCRRDVHVDVVRIGPASFVKVGWTAVAAPRHGTARRGVDGDARYGVAAYGVLGVVEVDVGAAAVGVQVTIMRLEPVAAVVGDLMILAAAVGEAGGRILAIAEVETGDVVAVAAGVGFRLVEQVDVVAAGTFVQVVVDDRPSGWLSRSCCRR